VQRQIVTFGGGGFSMEAGNPLLDEFVLELTWRARPRVCFLPQASGDADHYIVRFYRAFDSERCVPSHLSLRSERRRAFDRVVASASRPATGSTIRRGCCSVGPSWWRRSAPTRVRGRGEWGGRAWWLRRGAAAARDLADPRPPIYEPGAAILELRRVAKADRARVSRV
jgi:hypothetical protein